MRREAALRRARKAMGKHRPSSLCIFPQPAGPMAPRRVATLGGVARVRALDRLYQEHDAYRWMCGGVDVDGHPPADFRVRHVKPPTTR